MDVLVGLLKLGGLIFIGLVIYAYIAAILGYAERD